MSPVRVIGIVKEYFSLTVNFFLPKYVVLIFKYHTDEDSLRLNQDFYINWPSKVHKYRKVLRLSNFTQYLSGLFLFFT